MKKKIIGTIAIVAIAAMAAFNINLNTENNELSALTLDNVEALGAPEWDGVEILDKHVWYVNYHSPQAYECYQGGRQTCRF